MGSGEEWANDGGGCPIALAGIVAAVVLTGYGLVVVIADVAKLFS